MQRYGFALLALSMASTACGGGDDGPKGQQGQVNEATAKAATETTIQAVTTVTTTDDGQGAAGMLMNAAQQAQGIVTPTAPGVGGGTTAGTCDCDESGKTCTFQDCSDGGGQASMTGTISWDGDRVKCDLTFNVNSDGVGGIDLDLALTTQCDLTTTATSIDGTLNSTGKATGISIPGTGAGAGIDTGYNWSVNSKFNGVTYASGSATGGSVEVSATYNIIGQAYVGNATVEFP